MTLSMAFISVPAVSGQAERGWRRARRGGDRGVDVGERLPHFVDGVVLNRAVGELYPPRTAEDCALQRVAHRLQFGQLNHLNQPLPPPRDPQNSSRVPQYPSLGGAFAVAAGMIP